MKLLDASPEERIEVARLLGREPAGRFAVVVRRAKGGAVVIENEPHLLDGTPMPTLYWLVDPVLRDAVSRLESEGGVHRFEQLIEPAALAAAHERYAQRRDAAVVRRDLIVPGGGVGGTRVGVKCLHAHVANFLVNGDDPVGALVASGLDVGDLVVVNARA
ncbi:MAG TPA: DUF501 domain-containing protein [Acidimicrobiales bacterium]|nr:DUF501 domain-containing protein [Acidimicrobiales bacterium]